MGNFNNQGIGMKIRAFRQNAGLSQEKLAEQIGVTTQQVQKYETDKSRISADKIQLIANILRINASSFFNDRDSELTLNESETLFVKKLRKVKDVEVHECLLTILNRLAK